MAGQSERSFAHSVGLPHSTLKGILNGNRPSAESVDRVALAKGVTLEWLVRGEEAAVERVIVAAGPQVRDDVVGVPRYAATLSAGNGALHERAEQLSPIPFAPDFFGKKLGRSADGMVIVDAVGESMEPVIGDGDLVMIDTSDTQPREAIFAVALGEELFVKRVARRAHGIDLLSENPHYPPMVLEGPDLEELQIIGRVVWIGRTLAGPGRS